MKKVRRSASGPGVISLPGTIAEPVAETLVKEKIVQSDQPIPKEMPKEESGVENRKVAILSENGFEEVELTSPKKALEAAGVHVDVISPREGSIKAWNKNNWGKEVHVDVKLSEAKADDYDVVVLPGGVMNPDKLRQNKQAIGFLKHFIRLGKPIAAICHGVQTLIETGMIKGKTMTSYPSLKTDLKNAGVKWVDMNVVHNGQFITSRKPSDLKAFNSEIIYTLSAYDH